MNVAPRESWDTNQLQVIEEASDARLLVEAGPGTGKTAVACARLAYLIRENEIEPSNTWMISFTRTAVAEIRARLHTYIGDNSFAIRIVTIDSYAWSIHSGYDPNARLTGSYEENINDVIKLLEEGEGVAEELSRIEQVVIDEAQDIVGLRADLIEALARGLSAECGVTVFADEAQAIYGFSDDGIDFRSGAPGKTGNSLLERLRTVKEPGFTRLSLRKVHRTVSPGLRKIFIEVRNELLDAKNRCEGLCAETAQKIRDLADKSGSKWGKIKATHATADDLILFRTRAEALRASQFCNFPHHLRMSGYGATLPPWLALCFYDFVESFIEERVFLDVWSTRVENEVALGYGPTEAWKLLLKIAGRRDGAVDMKKLRQRLSQKRLPTELAMAEYGLCGPIVGTIHGSKGREASKVTLLLPNLGEFDDIERDAEEARVLFVGATRAKTFLTVGESPALKSKALSSKRTIRWEWTGKTWIEIGRDGDFSPEGLVGRNEFDSGDVVKAQRFLAKVADVVTTYSLQADPDLEWRYRVIAVPESLGIGVMSTNINNDLREVLNNRNRRNSPRLPAVLHPVRSQGCSTVVMASDDSELEILHEPWASSGFLLAPRIAAFPHFYSGWRRR